eukprot:767510-Hanusia_phi.AAC.7
MAQPGPKVTVTIRYTSDALRRHEAHVCSYLSILYVFPTAKESPRSPCQQPTAAIIITDHGRTTLGLVCS